jgi:hypothetical protein
MLYVTALFTGLALLLLHANMMKGLNHDEHMYVAAGVMIGQDGLMPYRDFTYFQMPNLALVYAGLFYTRHYLQTITTEGWQRQSKRLGSSQPVSRTWWLFFCCALDG